MSKKLINRRQFLQGAGGATLAIPFLPSFFGKAGDEALAAGLPRNFICLNAANGVPGGQEPGFPGVFFPNPAGKNYEVLDNFVQRIPLSAWSNTADLSHVIKKEFNSLKSKVSLIQGLDVVTEKDSSHNANIVLTADADYSKYTNSIDQIMAQLIYPSEPFFRWIGMQAGPEFGGANGRTLSSTTKGPRVPLRSPHALWKLLFNSGSGNKDQNWKQQTAAVDVVKEQANALLNSPKLSSADKQRLAEYLETVYTLQKRLDTIVTLPACTPLPSDLPASNHAITEGNYDEQVTAFLDIAVAAFKCGITRVITMKFGEEVDGLSYNFLDPVPPQNHHQLSHLEHSYKDPNDPLVRIHNYFMKQVAYLANKLAAADDGNSYSLLDRTLIYSSNSMGVMNFTGYHSTMSMQGLLIGGNDGGTNAIQQGYYWNLLTDQTRVKNNGDPYNPAFPKKGAAYNKLLAVIASFMGIPIPPGGFGDTVSAQNQYGSVMTPWKGILKP